MSLTAAQHTAIKADILANPDLNAIPNSADGAYAIADLYNKIALPDFIVWRVKLHERTITDITSPEGTVWSWVEFMRRIPEEQTGWARMFNSTYVADMSLPQVRAGFNDVFSGALGTAVAQRAHIVAAGKEKSTRLEKLLSTGTGTTLAPATRVFVGNVTHNEIAEARR